MPTYVYRAMSKTGLVVKNKIESPNKQSLLKTLKGNGLLPIEVMQIRYVGKQQKKTKKNITNIDEIMKNVNTTNIGKSKPKQLSTREKISLYFAATEKIQTRDIMIFTQNFYLLKKLTLTIYMH